MPSSQTPTLVDRLARYTRGTAQRACSHVLLNPAAFAEASRERAGYPQDASHRPHLLAALGWLERAQDATLDDGFARGYCLTWNPYFGLRGWQPSYPETTGYIIPTLYEAAEVLGEPRYAERATRAARWEIEIQLTSGAVQGGVVGQARSPAVFNTGQVLFGWLAAFERTGEGAFADAAIRGGEYLVSVMSPDGLWRAGNSLFARSDATLYNARVAWALAEAGARLGRADFTDAAARSLHAVRDRQADNGWFPNCCLDDPARPLLHTIAYTVRGLLEGGRVLGDASLLAAAERASEVLAASVSPRGVMPGRYGPDWSRASTWSCLTGEAQMANNWMRLHLITGEARWLEPVPRVLQHLKSTQNREHPNGGIRGGIKGSAPVSGGYGRYEILNWATKYFADALMRHQRVLDGTTNPGARQHRLA